MGGEVEGVVSSRRKLKGTISPTPNGNVHDVWPGQWDFSDLYGAGGNILLGRGLGDGRSQLYVFSGIRRMWTEFASGATNPETGTAGEDRERLARWPWAIGAGTTLHRKWPVDFRVRYSRSLTDWRVVDEGVRLDYKYAASGVLSFSLVVRLPSSAGTGPERSLLVRYRLVSLVRSPSSGGIGPERSLSERLSSVRLVRLPSSGGTPPALPEVVQSGSVVIR